MFLTALFLLADIPTTFSSDVEITPAVRAVVQKHRATFGVQTETELQALWKAGDRTAAALLGELLMMPNRTGGPDFVRSCDFSEKAGTHANALHNLATCYFLGNGRARDLTKARQLYGQAAGMGLAKSACAFGNMLIRGDGGVPDRPRGLDLCRRAADFGEPDAQTDYGGYLLTNQYLPKDAVAARRYLTLAGEKGQRNAAFLLGQIYWKGDGVERNVPQAAAWWIQAYEGGRRDAAFLIGNAATSLIVDAAKSKQPVANFVIDQARKWLPIAAEVDPDPKKREHAREMLKLLEDLLASRPSAR